MNIKKHVKKHEKRLYYASENNIRPRWAVQPRWAVEPRWTVRAHMPPRRLLCLHDSLFLIKLADEYKTNVKKCEKM